jgi:hypothetical protein
MQPTLQISTKLVDIANILHNLGRAGIVTDNKLETPVRCKFTFIWPLPRHLDGIFSDVSSLSV